MANTIQVRRGSKASLPVLAAAEFGFCTDTLEVFVGDSVNNHQLILNTTFTSKGGLLTATSSGTVVNLEAGSDGTILMADSFAPEGVRWSDDFISVETDPIFSQSEAANFASGDASKLSGIAANANNYIHPNHSGDVTSTADGATAIANSAVTLAKMANMDTTSLIYRKTAAAGPPEVQTLATLKTDLGLTGTNSGDQNLFAKAYYNHGTTTTAGGTYTFDGTAYECYRIQIAHTTNINPAGTYTANRFYRVAFYIVNGNAAAITFSASIKWVGGVKPTFVTSGTDLVVFTTIDQGTTWHGSVAGLDYK